MLRSAFLAAVLLAAVAASAVAQTQILDELKFGVLAHDVGLFDKHLESGADLNFEVLFTPPDFLAIIGSPRPHIGGSLNTAGNTNDGYFGLTWGITLIQNLFGSGNSIFLNGRLISQGGWIERNGVSCFNLYRPPAIKHGDKTQAEIWLDHGRTIFPDDIDHIVRWLAHRVQRPEEKINHAIVLGGSQGVGKDSLLEPVKRAVGAWNFSEVSPQQLLGRFNGFAKSER